ncbi:MAG: PAS domain S-box protein, partial [Sulfurimonas sp.]|nr:PAS domain S-box protein [Sulfurimonas sp.]
YIAMAMLFLSLFIIATTAYMQKINADKKLDSYTKQINLGIKHTVNHYIHDYEYLSRRMLETENIMKLMKKRDREGLYNSFKKKWELLTEEEPNLTIIHFLLADGTSFLRMHRPEVFGDKLTDVRPMINEISTFHKKIVGYETGKYGTTYRIITPVFDESGEYIGAFEIGLNPKFILNSVREVNNFCGMMFIKEDSLELFYRPNDRVIDKYVLQSELSLELEKIYAELHVFGKLENGMKISVGDKRYVSHSYILNDYKNKPKVKLLFFQNITEFGTVRNYFIFGLFLVVGLLLLIIIWLIHRRIGLYQNRVTDSYKKQIQKLYESEHRFALLYEKAPDAYQSLDIDGNLIVVNAKWLEELGYDKSEVIGKNFSEFLTPAFKSIFRENFSKFKASGSITGIEFELVKKDGEIITTSYNGKIVREDNGEFKQTHCIFTNITQSKKIQERLEFNKRYLQTIFDVTPGLMITTDGEDIDKANPAMLEFFGYETIEEFKNEHDCVCDYFIGDNDCLVPEIDGVRWLEYILQRESQLHKVCMNKGAKRHHFIVQAHTLELDDKKRSVVIFNDITDLEDLSDRLEYAIKGSTDGLWDWNIVTDEFFFSPKWKEMLGYRDDELENSFSTWEDRVHPDDLERALQNIEKSHTDPNYVFNYVHRLRHKDGHWVWILDRGQTIFNEDGQAVRMIGFHTDLTEKKRLETQLIENERVYLDFFENTKSANIIYTTEDGGETFKIKSLNHSVEELEGVKREEIIGKEVETVFEGIEKFGLLEILKEVYKSAEAQKMPLTFYEDNKLLGWRENYVFKLSNGDIVASYEDRTQEKQLENDLRISQHQFEQFMEYMPANVMIKDENHHVIYANKRANDFFKQENMIGKTSVDLLPEHLVETINKIDDLIIKEGTHEELLELTDDNGEKLVYRNLGFKIVDNDKIKIGIVSLDITEEYRLKETLDEKEELMIAQSRHAAMGEMISMIAHQWRQPISVIAMDANNILADIELEMLEEKSLKVTSEDIIKQTQELSKTIDDFRNFFRPERNAQEVIVKEVFDDALGVIGKSLDNNQIEFVLELDEKKKIITYTRELMQVFINIIKNAKEALIENKIQDKKITVYTSQEREKFKFRICDNAGGINAEIIEKIFNPYFTTKGEKNGTGLGLYMSKTIVEKHLQGSLTVKNDDEGACFEIIIPHVIKEES